MTFIAALVLVIFVMALISLLGVPARAREVMQCSRQAVADVRSKTLSEIEKEHAVQAHARRLFVAFLMITILLALALVVPVGLLALLAEVDWVDFDEVLAATLSWPILLTATVIGIAVFALPKKQQP